MRGERGTGEVPGRKRDDRKDVTRRDGEGRKPEPSRGGKGRVAKGRYGVRETTT